MLPFMIILLCLCLSGCGTVLMREYPSLRADEFPYYPATCYDVSNIAEGGAFYTTDRVIGWLVIVPIHVIDLPISLVTDTLLFPADYIRETNKEENTQTNASR